MIKVSINHGQQLLIVLYRSCNCLCKLFEFWSHGWWVYALRPIRRDLYSYFTITHLNLMWKYWFHHPCHCYYILVPNLGDSFYIEGTNVMHTDDDGSEIKTRQAKKFTSFQDMINNWLLLTRSASLNSNQRNQLQDQGECITAFDLFSNDVILSNSRNSDCYCFNRSSRR